MYAVQFELGIWEKKEQNKKILHLIFLTVTRINDTLEVYFTLEELRVFIYKFSLHCCGNLRVVSIPYIYVQDGILNLHTKGGGRV